MDTKQIAIYGGGFLGSFLVLLVIMYMIYPYLHPDKMEKAESDYSALSGSRFDTERYSPEAVDALNQQITSLQETIDSLNSRKSEYVSTIDSLQLVVSEITDSLEETRASRASLAEAAPVESSGPESGAESENTIESQDPEKIRKEVSKANEEQLQEISKSLLRLDEDALSPIVNLLGDDQLISIYKSGSSLQRQKLLQSLEPKKAAEILKKVMS